MNAKRKEQPVRKSVKRGKRKPVNQPRVPGTRRSPRFTGLLAVADEAVRHEAQYYGVSVSYVVACCVAIALEVPIDPAMMYDAMNRRKLRHGLRLIKR